MQYANPFTPTFGTVPAHLAGRSLLLQDMRIAFEAGPGDPNLSTVIIGARGTGKTALLSRIAEEALRCGWISANVSAAPGMLEDIIQRTKEAASEFVEAEGGLRLKGLGIGIAQLVDIEFERQVPEKLNWRSQMNGIFKQLDRYDVGLLITVDEVVGDLDEMVQLARVYQHFVRERKKAALVMAGLPYHLSSLLSNKQVSFLRRSRQRFLGRIADEDIADALRATIADGGRSISDEALAASVGAIEGFPFMMQLVGYRTWASCKGDTISLDDALEGIALARREMREGVLDTTLNELSAGDLRFLDAMLPDGNGSALADVASRMGVKSNYASKYKARLLEAGIIMEGRGGILGFCLPGLREYLQETRTGLS